MTMESTRTKPRSIHYGYIVLFSSVLVALGSNGFGRFAYPVILPAMKQGLGLTYEQTGWLASWNFIGYLALSVIGGVLASRFGPRAVITVGLILLGITLIGTGFAPDFSTALLMRTLSGIGNGGSFVPVMALSAAWFAASKRGLASGFITGGIGLGLVISGMLLPGIIVGNGSDGWRYAWYFIGAIVILVGLISLVLLRNRPGEMGLVPIGGSPEPKAPSASTSVTSTSGLLASAQTIYAKVVFWQLSFAYFLFGLSYVIYSTYFVAYLVKEGSLTEAAAGGLWAIAGAISIISGSIWGIVSDVWGRKYGLAIVFFLQTVSYFMFAALPNMYGFYISAILFGLTAWSIPAIMAAACGDYAGSKLAPAALGSVTFFYGIGQAIGPYIGGRIADATGSFVLAFFLAAATAALGIVASLALRPPRTNC